MTHTEWKGKPATSLDAYIAAGEIDPATGEIVGEIDPGTCKTDCLKDVSKICPKDVDGKEMLTVFFKCPSWENPVDKLGNPVTYYCQQQLEAPEKEDQCA